MGGSSVSADLTAHTYSWQLDYRQYFSSDFAVSADWINEGHLLGHAPDGVALEGWYVFPLLAKRFSVSFGAGPYLFFDTRLPPKGGTIDSHGIAPIFSAAVTSYLSDRWFWRLAFNRINPPVNDIKVNTAVVGVGLWLGGEAGPKDGRWTPANDPPSEAEPFDPENSVTLYLGWRDSNTRSDRQTPAGAFEYRREISRHLAASASFIYEGDPDDLRRTGIATEIWAVERVPHSGGITVGLGAGAYFYLDPKAGNSDQNTAAAGGVISPMVEKRWGASPWSNRLVWNRIITNYDRDADVWMLGLSYHWP